MSSFFDNNYGSGAGGAGGSGTSAGNNVSPSSFNNIGSGAQNEAVNQAGLNEQQTIQNIQFNGAASRAGTRMRSASQAAQAAGPA